MITPNAELRIDEVAAHYDELDRFYREVWGEHVHHGLWTTGRETSEEAVRHLVDVVAGEAGIGPGSRVCDVGCGYGATARMLAERGAQVTGLSISAAQLAYARQATAGDNPTYRLCDWLANDLPAGSFDAVLAIESSEHMPDKAGFFSEARRVLVPGGRLVVCAWLAREAPGRLEIRHLLEPICREGRLPGLGSRADYEALIAAAGLEAVAFADVSARVKKTWPICAGRFLAGVVRHKSYRDFLRDRTATNRVFALTVLRIWAAYELGSMHYGIFTARRPPAGSA